MYQKDVGHWICLSSLLLLYPLYRFCHHIRRDILVRWTASKSIGGPVGLDLPLTLQLSVLPSILLLVDRGGSTRFPFRYIRQKGRWNLQKNLEDYCSFFCISRKSRLLSDAKDKAAETAEGQTNCHSQCHNRKACSLFNCNSTILHGLSCICRKNTWRAISFWMEPRSCCAFRRSWGLFGWAR